MVYLTDFGSNYDGKLEREMNVDLNFMYENFLKNQDEGRVDRLKLFRLDRVLFMSKTDSISWVFE